MKIFILNLLSLTISGFISCAQPGFLDPSFGSSGTVFGPFISIESHAKAIAVQADGKILVTGYKDNGSVYRAFIVRFDTTGNPDPSFPTVFTNIFPVGEISQAIAIQPDSKIVIAGHTDNFPNQQLMLARFTSAGVPDSTFGNAGYTLNVVGSNAYGMDLVIQPDGKILLAGTILISSNDMLLMRFHSDGSIDSTFGNAGKVVLDINNTVQEGITMALQPDGKIVVAGSTSSMQTGFDAMCTRFMPNGLPDLSFGTNGVFISTQNTDDDAAYGIALQADGKIVMAGFTYTNFTYSDNLIIRLDSTGTPDNSFNGTGYVINNSNGNDHIATNILIQQDGKIIISGRGLNSTMDMAVARFTQAGAIDTTFGNAGRIYTDVAQDFDYSLASALQPDGKILLAGYYFDSGIENMVVTRYLPNATVSLNEIDTESGILLWPQPASGFLNIAFDKATVPDDFEIRIYSLTGQLLMKKHPAHNPELMSVNELETGMYMLEIKNLQTQSCLYKRFLKN